MSFNLSNVGGLYLSSKRKNQKMVAWCSRPWRPLENKKLGSFALYSCNNGKKKRHDAHAKFLFCQSNPIAFLPDVWIHGYRENKKPLNLKSILLAAMLL